VLIGRVPRTEESRNAYTVRDRLGSGGIGGRIILKYNLIILT
jgi:hypothetical protein